MNTAADSSASLRFEVALSFPGEYRDFVEAVAGHLASRFTEERILYDHYHDVEFARLDLNTYLPALYRKHSELIVVFLCPEYAAKLWCRLEWRHVSQLIATVDAKRVMFLSFGQPGDLSDLGIVSGDGYIDVLRFTPAAVAEKIAKRLDLNRVIAPSRSPSPSTRTNAPIPADISRIIEYAPAELIGREVETTLLSDAWAKAVRGESKRAHVLSFVALGGEGKTSLVAKWAVDLAHQGWPECEAVFAWSFYRQGILQTAASSDVFLKEALTFFGDATMANSAQGVFEKGRRLAQLVGERRALLILDGLEPLQYAPTSPTAGELKDHGLAALLTGLAGTNRGLCVVTSRYSIKDLRAYWQTAAPEIKLTRLSTGAAVALLRSLGVRGTTKELETLVDEVRGHALTVKVIGAYLNDAHGGDIRKRDLVKLEEADAEERGGHAFRVMDAYARWFEGEGEKGNRALALLRLLGLFDRPATGDCVAALLAPPAIPDLTDSIVGISEAQRNVSLTRLVDAKLLIVNRDGAGLLVALDAHPLLREYFARQLRTQRPEAWRAGHRRLYEHLYATTKEGDQPTIEDLQPLYQAVVHGCHAGMQQEACDKVYYARIQLGGKAYSTMKLGTLASELGAIGCFFEMPWSRCTTSLTEDDRGWLFGEAAFRLHALGRLAEALEPTRASLAMRIEQADWKNAAIISNNLSELEMTLGNVDGAAADAERGVTYAERSGDLIQRIIARCTVGDALHQMGRTMEAERLFREAGEMQAERQTGYPLLHALSGFRYCDLLLATTERAAWQLTLRSSFAPDTSSLASCEDVSRRAAATLDFALSASGSLLNVALNHLTLGRTALCDAIRNGVFDACRASLHDAVDGLRRAGQQGELPRGLLTRAWSRGLTGDRTGAQSAQADLDEAWEIAERGPMPLFMAEVHLHRARLFGPHTGETPYPWDSPASDLKAARRLIEKHGYWRRKEELEDAEAAAGDWASSTK